MREAISDVCVTLHGLETGTNSEGVKLGPIPKAQIILEGEAITALLDTGSPVTIVSLEHLLQILARTRPPGTTPEQWRAMVENHLKPTSLSLQNYGGDELTIVCQISVSLTHGEHYCWVIIVTSTRSLLTEKGFQAVLVEPTAKEVLNPWFLQYQSPELHE